MDQASTIAQLAELNIKLVSTDENLDNSAGGKLMQNVLDAVPGIVDDITIRRRFKLIERHLDERMRRLVAAAEAEAVGFGGASVVARATGVSRRAIRIGARELKQAPRGLSPSGRIRQPGGGRKRTVTQDPTLALDLESLIEPVTRGDPETPLRWTAKSVGRLSGELKRMGHKGESSDGGRDASPVGI